MNSPRTPASLADVMPHEAMIDALRWNSPDFSGPEPAPAPAPSTPPPPPGPTVAELEAIEAQARDAGYQAGLEQGRQAAAAELDIQRGQLKQLLDALARPLDGLDQQVETELAELALHIARQVVYRTIELRPEHIAETVKTALASLPLASRQIKVRMTPEDAALLAADPAASEDRGWQVVGDASLQRGDVLVDAEMSHIDARVKIRLDRLAETVLASPSAVQASDD